MSGLSLVVICATRSNAVCSEGGNVLPRFSARRRIPAHAFGLKKNLGATDSSKMSDNEHPTASLGDPEVATVQHPVGPPIPEVAQRPEDGSQVPSSVRRQEASDVLDDAPAGTELSQDAVELPPEPGPFSTQALAMSCDGDVLAGEPSVNKVNGSGSEPSASVTTSSGSVHHTAGGDGMPSPVPTVSVGACSLNIGIGIVAPVVQ
jgi:hypothetical protein